MTDRELLRTGLNEYLSEVSDETIDNLLKFSDSWGFYRSLK